MKRLENKVAIVTGGATGIGEAICKKFAAEGCRVVVNGFPDDPVDDVVESILKEGGEATAHKADISLEQNAIDCIELTKDTYGRLDILINNAGVFPIMAEIQDYPADVFDYLVNNNIRTAFLMTKHAIPELKKTKGCIISAGSEAGQLGLAKNTPYGGTKGWMHAFMKGVAVEQAKHNIRANCVCPGAVDTAWTHKEFGPMNSEDEEMIVAATPLGRRGTPEEIANVYLFLASDEASYVTGSLFQVDGGITVSKGAVGKQAERETREEPESELHLEHSMSGATSMPKR